MRAFVMREGRSSASRTYNNSIRIRQRKRRNVLAPPRGVGAFFCYTAAMNAAVFYTAVGGFALGIFIRSFIVFGLPAITALLLVAVALAAVWRKNDPGAASPVLLISIGLAACAFGLLRMEVATWSDTDPALEPNVGQEVTIDGTLVREPDRRETTTHLYVDDGNTVVLAITDRFGDYAYGDRVRVSGVLAKPESFTTDLGRTFNYPGYLRARGVTYQIRYGEIERIAVGEGNPIVAALVAGKHRFMRSLESVIPEPHAGLGEGLLLGEKRALGESLETAFRKTGIIHIVVLSGYNVLLVVTFVMSVFAYLFDIKFRTFFGILAIGAFAVLVGLSATVVRASLMAGLLLVARFTGRTYAVVRALSFAGAVMLVHNPHLLAFDTGFQLSFLATVGLILVAPMIETQLSFVPNPRMIGVREFLTATLATQFFVLPLLLYQIGEFSVVSVAVNVLVLPMVPVAMFLTFAAGMAGLLSASLALPFAYAAYWSLAYILAAAEWFAALPFAAYVVPAFPFWVVPLSYGVMAYVLWRYWTSDKSCQPPKFIVDSKLERRVG